MPFALEMVAIPDGVLCGIDAHFCNNSLVSTAATRMRR